MSERVRLAGASLRLDSMLPEGRDISLAVPQEDRERLAEQLGISAVEKLVVSLHADRFSGGMRVAGHISARIVQPSVVSLEPVTQDIEDTIDRVFLPGGEKPFADKAGAEVFVDLEGEDIPDHFEGPEADLSDLIVETLALAIDPYPRLEGESLGELRNAEVNAEPESPFAKLKALKNKE